MSTRAKFAASVASAGVVALGWHHYAGAAPATAGVAQPVATTTVTVTETPRAAKTSGSTASTSKSTAKSASPTTKKSTSSAATTSSTTARQNTQQTTTTTTTTTQAQAQVQAATGWRDGTYRGQTVTHMYGTITVTVTISGGRISNLSEQYTDPGDPRSQYIDQQAIPMVKQEVLAADSANVSTIGGATFTSAAYLQSLQSALNQA